ncbi:PREDICTED: WD repeat-containing protein 88 isoform X1 [Crocodylus porosus]|uniref:WD repeat-containing protein 88 isoform X1 n=1 Tax=Crocodylus porosus TaxID=8502 RepID=UPI00093AA255|nr:PREDICTED: WD repeat-containing protein 88 isoform X1 [Crocodylus porosus]
MAAVTGRGDPLALGEVLPPPLPPAASSRGSRWGDHEEIAQIPFKILQGHKDAVSSCHFCCEDTKILSSSFDRSVKLWDVAKGVHIQVFEEEHTAPISECSLTPDNKRVITSSYDKTVKAWDMETGKMLWTIEHEGLVTSCNISYDGKYVVSGLDKENAICITDAVNATTAMYIQDHHRSTVTRCCFDPDNQRVASVSYDKTIKLWDIVAQSTTVTIDEGHSNVISDCCFTLDGRYLCTASWDRTLKIWDIKTGDFRHHGPIVLKEGHQGSVSSCLFSKDASLVVSGAYDKSIAVWDIRTGYKKLTLQGHGDWVMDVAVSSNKKWILSSSKDSTLRLWNIENADHIPAVIENRKRGSQIVQCEDCEKPFSLLQCNDSGVVTKCVFCRLAMPTRNIMPLPPTCSPDL